MRENSRTLLFLPAFLRLLQHDSRAMPPTQLTGYVFEPDAAVMDYMSEDEDIDIRAQPYEMETKDRHPEDDIVVAPEPEYLDYQQLQLNPAEDKADLELLRGFLEVAGVPLTSIQEDRQCLLGLLRTHLGQGPNASSV